MNKILVLGAALTISAQALAAVEPNMIQADIQKQVDNKQLTPKQATVLRGSYCVGAMFSAEMQTSVALETGVVGDMPVAEIVKRFDFAVPFVEKQMKVWMSETDGFNDDYYNVGLEYAQSAAEGDVDIKAYITDLQGCGRWLIQYTPYVSFTMKAREQYDAGATGI